MNLDPIEALLLPTLKRLLGRKVEVLAGPPTTPALGGMQPMVFVHARSFVDADGITREGGRIARRPVTEGRLKGVAEERPGRILLEVTCLSSAYRTVQDLAGAVSPQVLRSLESAREFPLGALQNRSVRLVFSDFQACLAGAEFTRHEEDELAWHLGLLAFHLDGFLHVTVTSRGGLVAKPTVRPTPKKQVPARKKPATVTKPAKKTGRSRE